MRNLFRYSTIKNLAFSLAEIVLVLGIIGAVGVLGVTNAKKDTDTAEKVTQLKKTYEIIDAAFTQAVMENGSHAKWGTNGGYPDPSQLWAVVSPYFQLLKNCGTGTGCWKDAVPLKLNRTATNTNINSSNHFAKGILANGVSIAISPKSEDFIRGKSEGMLLILVDVNGKKGLNMMGNDIFGFLIDTNEQLTPLISTRNPNEEIHHTTIDLYKTPWVLQFGNMDYLKPCAGNLSWTGNHTCR